jgi:hypothetical protein
MPFLPLYSAVRAGGLRHYSHPAVVAWASRPLTAGDAGPPCSCSAGTTVILVRQYGARVALGGSTV